MVINSSAEEKNDNRFVKRWGLWLKWDCIFASQVAINYFEYKLTNLTYQKVSQCCMHFSDYHVYDSIKTIKNCQMYVENELINENEVKEDEEDFVNINCVQIM